MDPNEQHGVKLLPKWCPHSLYVLKKDGVPAMLR